MTVSPRANVLGTDIGREAYAIQVRYVSRERGLRVKSSPD